MPTVDRPAYVSQHEERHSHLVTYLVVFVLLMILLAATVGVAYIELGRFTLLVTLLIAFCKAMLVVLFFMHLIYGNRLTWVVAGGALVWVAIGVVFTFADYLTRGWLIVP